MIYTEGIGEAEDKVMNHCGTHQRIMELQGKLLILQLGDRGLGKLWNSWQVTKRVRGRKDAR